MGKNHKRAAAAAASETVADQPIDQTASLGETPDEAAASETVADLGSEETESVAPVALRDATTLKVSALNKDECLSELDRLGDPIGKRKALRRDLDAMIAKRDRVLKDLDADIAKKSDEYRALSTTSQFEADRIRLIRERIALLDQESAKASDQLPTTA